MLLHTDFGPKPCIFRDIDECRKLSGDEEESNPFAHLIGADRSLKRQVEQAKAAILYPPDGLHTLIVGQTGVGKTLFAHLMFSYGKVMHRFAEDAPFVTFNCADYYNNPQLLISHVFGHIKGAFTGADSSRAGLVEEADGGVLFLDEIHRLPPEGQEMIFYFMDTGSFNRLGETTRSRHAKVLIIGATTEDPDSALTKTFVRRIPNIITIRPLAERTLEEKLDILKLLFMDEAQRVKKPIRISVESVKALIGSIGGGNVGQLKSNIKLLCAQAFLNGIDNPNYIEVDFKMLPPNVKDGLLTLSANRQALTELTKYVSEPLVVSPPGGSFQMEDDASGSENGFNLYQVVEDKVALLKGEGISDDLIKQIVATDVNVYVKDLYNKKHSVNMTTRERLLKSSMLRWLIFGADFPLCAEAHEPQLPRPIPLCVQPALVGLFEAGQVQRSHSAYGDRGCSAAGLGMPAGCRRNRPSDREPLPYQGAGQRNRIYCAAAGIGG